MNYLNIEEVLLMHFRIMEEFHPYQSKYGITKPDQLESAIARPQQSAGGKDAYEDISSKAAALTESIIGNHPFEDGNKRVGITAGCVFMMINGYEIIADDDGIYKVAMNAAEGKWKFEELKQWFNENTP